MQDKIQELTEKIYNEGVQKAKTDAENIINEAKKSASEIEHQAKLNAKKIVDDAEKQSNQFKEQVEAELKMSINQALSALKQDLANLITMQALQPAVKEAFTDAAFVQKLIETVVKGWMEKESFDLKIILSDADKSKMEQFFKNRLSAELNKKLEITSSSGIKSGFKAGPADDSYQISFTEQDFLNFFKAYLRPKTAELLFKE
jgi:V/A-type H+-transporting ATPase subunit E